MADCLHVRSFIIIYQEYHKLITTPHTTYLHLSLKPRYFRFMTLKFYCSETLRPHCCLYSHIQRSPPTTAFMILLISLKPWATLLSPGWELWAIILNECISILGTFSKYVFQGNGKVTWRYTANGVPVICSICT